MIDSDWMIDFLKGKFDAVRLLAILGPRGLAISLITFGEVYDGIYGGSDPSRHEAVFLDALDSIKVLGIDREVMKKYARIRGLLRPIGQMIGDADILIAATAIHNDLTLVTRNRRHYDRIPGLNIYEETTTAEPANTPAT